MFQVQETKEVREKGKKTVVALRKLNEQIQEA
jgi:hypothetical protein